MFEGEVTGCTDAVNPSLPSPSSACPSPPSRIAGYRRAGKITVAVRPEKIAITRDEPAGAQNALAGLVQDLGYFGKDSLYRVKLPTGTVLSVNSVNARRAGENERVAQWEDKVWLSFDPSSVILLTE